MDNFSSHFNRFSGGKVKVKLDFGAYKKTSLITHT